MRRLATLGFVLLSCGPHSELPTQLPDLCVETLTGTPSLACLAEPSLKPHLAISAVHILPPFVDPYGHTVAITLRAAGIESRRDVAYAAPTLEDGGLSDQLRATTVFSYPEDGGCVFFIEAQIFDVNQSVTANVEDCTP